MHSISFPQSIASIHFNFTPPPILIGCLQQCVADREEFYVSHQSMLHISTLDDISSLEFDAHKLTDSTSFVTLIKV